MAYLGLACSELLRSYFGVVYSTSLQPSHSEYLLFPATTLRQRLQRHQVDGNDVEGMFGGPGPRASAALSICPIPGTISHHFSAEPWSLFSWSFKFNFNFSFLHILLELSSTCTHACTCTHTQTYSLPLCISLPSNYKLIRAPVVFMMKPNYLSLCFPNYMQVWYPQAPRTP